MGTVTFNRPPRVVPPEIPAGELLLEPPPEIPPPQQKQGFTVVLRMLPMVAGALAMGLMMVGTTGGRGPLGAVIGGMYGISMLGMMLTQTGRGNDEQAIQLDTNRRDYFKYLSQTRKEVIQEADQQRKAALFRHPSPNTLWQVPGSGRMWERRVESQDFAAVRCSVGIQQFSKVLSAPQSRPAEELEPLTASALRRFIRTHRSVSEIPLALNISRFNQVKLYGDEKICRQLAYAIVAQYVTWHSPNDARVLACIGSEVQQLWQWLKWLPHLQSPTQTDGVGPVRLFANNWEDSVGLVAGFHDCPPETTPVLLMCVVDGKFGQTRDLDVPAAMKVVSLEITGEMKIPKQVENQVAYLQVDETELVMYRQGEAKTAITSMGIPDQISTSQAEVLARRMSRYRLPDPTIASAEESKTTAPKFVPLKDYPTMLGISDPFDIDVQQCWKPRPVHNYLRVPFGVLSDGSPTELDIKEAAEGGMGPHGICIGATGSGKSEFLRTLVLGLAMTHSSEQLNFVLVDFKGGATFLGLEDLPHTSAVITNLADDVSLVDRMQDAIAGELERRQEVLRAAGNFKNRADYEKARQTRTDLEPMPSLLIIVDEFSELLTVKPEFLDIFLQIGRVGRSIGVHQLLASQRLEEGKLRGLDTFLSYRIALRTFSPGESRTIIGVADAYGLPNEPGHGYLKFGVNQMVRFKASYVSGPWKPLKQETGKRNKNMSQPQSNLWVPPVFEFTTNTVPRIEPPQGFVKNPEPLAAGEVSTSQPTPTPVESSRIAQSNLEEETLLQLVVGKLKGQGLPARQVWLAPLEQSATLGQLFGRLEQVPGRGFTCPNLKPFGGLQVPIGIVDKPRLQRRDPLWVDFSAAHGNMAVVGGPQSGKSMTLRSAIAAMALTHTPEEVGFYCLDFGGGGLTSMQDLAHIGSTCGKLDPDRVRRTIAELTGLLSSREELFQQLKIDSMASYRSQRAEGTLAKDRFPTDVFLVIDDWRVFREVYENLEQDVVNLAASGLGFGIHVWVSAPKWLVIRSNLKEYLLTKIELKIGDSFESEIERKLQSLVPPNKPGRGLTQDGYQMLIGLPRVDSISSNHDVVKGQRDMINLINSSWTGPKAAQVRMLPDNLEYEQLTVAYREELAEKIVFGINENRLEAVFFDPNTSSHFLVVGGPKCGKSNFLRVMLKEISTKYSPDQARVLVIDYDRSLLSDVENIPHVLSHLSSEQAVKGLIGQLVDKLKTRLPPANITSEELKNRSWWSGPEVFILVDDYDLVSGVTQNPLAPFEELVRPARDIGLHLIVTRSLSNISRMSFSDKLLPLIVDTLAPVLVMSGEKGDVIPFSQVKPTPLPAGRGTLSTREETQLIQIANLSGPDQVT